MHQRGKQREVRKPLLVKEIILPDNPQPNSTFWPDKVIAESGHEITVHMKIGQHEGEVLSLMVRQQKPLESYFEGTRKEKKIRKRKKKNRRTVISPSELFPDGGQTLSEGERKQQIEKALTEEEKTEIRLLHLKIYEYEKMREQAQRKNYVRQKMAEEDYICQLENLVAMWFKTGKRRHVTKNDDDLVVPKSFSKETPNKRIMNEISFTSRECCGDNPESPPGKSKKVFEEVSTQAQTTDDVLMDDFYEKLVFVDEDSN